MRLLIEAEIEAHVCFPRNEKDFLTEIKIPSEGIEFYLRNGNVELGIETPTLIAVLVFEGESLETGFEQGREIINEILQALAAVTSSTFRYRRAIRLVDWTVGNQVRNYKYSKPFMGHQLPYEYLDPALVYSAMRIYLAQKKSSLSLAVHWFSSGLSARLPEDQFQFFWFVLEYLAEHLKPAEKVNDKCQTCGSSLYCETCGCHPTHKAFNKQVIESLIKEFLVAEQSEATIKKLFRVRNMLMHGSRSSEIESDICQDIVVPVNELAAVARSALFSTLMKSIPSERPDDQIYCLETQDYTHKVMNFSVSMVSGQVEDAYVSLKKIATPEVDIIYSERGVQGDLADTMEKSDNK